MESAFELAALRLQINPLRTIAILGLQASLRSRVFIDNRSIVRPRFEIYNSVWRTRLPSKMAWPVRSCAAAYMKLGL